MIGTSAPDAVQGKGVCGVVVHITAAWPSHAHRKVDADQLALERLGRVDNRVDLPKSLSMGEPEEGVPPVE